jgi:hypothetical protein
VSCPSQAPSSGTKVASRPREIAHAPNWIVLTVSLASIFPYASFGWIGIAVMGAVSPLNSVGERSKRGAAGNGIPWAWPAYGSGLSNSSRAQGLGRRPWFSPSCQG